MPQDEEHLRLLAIFHYILGGLAALFSFFPLVYGVIGLFLLNAPAHPQHGSPPPPPFVGWIFIGFGCFFFLLGLVFATCTVLSGRFLARRKRYWFIFVMACIECLFFPFGVILGVFTLIVLSRPPVKELFRHDRIYFRDDTTRLAAFDATQARLDHPRLIVLS